MNNVAAVCEPRCMNDGYCSAPNQCSCTLGYIGRHCQIRKYKQKKFPFAAAHRYIFRRTFALLSSAEIEMLQTGLLLVVVVVATVCTNVRNAIIILCPIKN